jgi:hypothetical protein
MDEIGKKERKNSFSNFLRNIYLLINDWISRKVFKTHQIPWYGIKQSRTRDVSNYLLEISCFGIRPGFFMVFVNCKVLITRDYWYHLRPGFYRTFRLERSDCQLSGCAPGRPVPGCITCPDPPVEHSKWLAGWFMGDSR